jgi:hypothetical protein
MPTARFDRDSYERTLDHTFREVRAEMAGHPAEQVLPALLARFRAGVPGQVPPLEFVTLLADVIAQRLPVTASTISRARSVSG